MPDKVAVFHNLPSGGALRALLAKVRLFEGRGWEVALHSFSTAEGNFLPRVPVRGGEHVEPLIFAGPGRFGRYAEATRRTAERINRSDADWVYVDKCRFFGSPPILRLLKKTSVYYCHEPLGLGEYAVLSGTGRLGEAIGRLSARQIMTKCLSLGARLRTKVEDRRAIRAARRVLAPSCFAARWIERVYGVRPAVIYQGVDAEFFSPDPLTVRENVVLSVGRIEPRKNHGFAVRALARLPAARRPRLVVVCDGIEPAEKDRLEREAAALGVAWEIRHRPSQEELRRLYRSARAVLCAGIREPFGLVPLEAMACGTPVLAASDGGYPETVLDGRTGFLIERDPEAWAVKIETCGAETDRLGRAGREHILKDWIWGKFADSLIETVRSPN